MEKKRFAEVSKNLTKYWFENNHQNNYVGLKLVARIKLFTALLSCLSFL